MDTISVAYFGAPDFSARFLEKLVADRELPVKVALVVTQPDRPVGRRGVLTETPVKTVAKKHNIPVWTDVKNHKTNSLRQTLASLDLALLFAYGEMITKELLDAPKHGFWNIHPSLLPKYRGASPLAYPIMMGEGTSGVSLMRMDEQLDHGPLLGQKTYQVSPTDLRKKVEESLTDISYELFCEIVKKIGGFIPHKNQNHKLATFTRKLTKNDGYVSPEFLRLARNNKPIITEHLPKPLIDYMTQNTPALPRLKTPAGETLWNFYRAMHPWPGIWTKITINGVEKRVKITGMEFTNASPTPKITRVQLEGKKEVDYPTFCAAYGSIV